VRRRMLGIAENYEQAAEQTEAMIKKAAPPA
jgi:hypothetical protein